MEYIFFSHPKYWWITRATLDTRLCPIRPAYHSPNREKKKRQRNSTFRRFLLRKRKSICRCSCRVCRAGRDLPKLCPAILEAFVGCDALLAKKPRMVVTERENPSDGKRFEVRRKRHGVLRRLLECSKGIEGTNVSFSCKSYNSPSEWHWTPIGRTPRAVLLVVAVVKADLASKERGGGGGGNNSPTSQSSATTTLL